MADRAADPLAASIVGLGEFVHGRFAARLEGLTDDELFFEPAAGCWTVRERPDGQWAPDGPRGGEPPEPAPLTTIAWRLTHLACHVLGGLGAWLRDGADPFEGDPDVPHTATQAIAAHERSWTRFHEGMVRLDAAGWRAPIGERFGPHAEASTADLVLHALDEYVHHAAEVSLLRDLYRARTGAA